LNHIVILKSSIPVLVISSEITCKNRTFAIKPYFLHKLPQ